MAKYLVTGAAGFIGSSLALRLIQEGHEVFTIDNLSTGYENAIPEGVNFFRGDCSDPVSIKKLKKNKFDAIFHIAGQSSGEISFENPIYDIKSNTESTLLLLDFCLHNDCGKFIYASSMSVYGLHNKENVKETLKCDPKSFYAVGKLASENYMKIYSSSGIQTTALRLFNTYGPGQNMSNMKQGMISIYLAQFLKNNEILVKGSGERYRDFIYIDDVIECFMKSLTLEKDAPKVINVGTGKKTLVNDLLNMIEIKLETGKNISFKNGTPGDLFGITANIELMDKFFGKTKKTSLEDGLDKMINFYNASSRSM